MKFIYSIQSEWLKTKGSAASWLCIIGGFFIPTIYLIYFISKGISIDNPDFSGYCWEMHFNNLMLNMKVFLLPMGVILASSLITQMEFKNNTWKQVHTTPQAYTTIFLAKFSVIALMTVKFFLFFTLGILISGAIPCLLKDQKLPAETFPLLHFLKANVKVFVLCLPILAVQYLISLQFKNFLVPVGIGLVALIGSMMGSGWEYIYISPYSYNILDVRHVSSGLNIYYKASIYFLIVTACSYLLYLRKKEKG
jgi:lantibiotic transport system permease protein